MHIDGIIHHALVQTTDRTNQPLTAGKMSRISLCRKITRIILATQADREFIQCDIFAHLCQQTHSFRIMHLYIFECRIRIMIHEYPRSRTAVSTENDNRARYQFLVLPGSADLAWRNLCNLFAAHADITGRIDQSLCISFKSDPPSRDMLPTFPFGDKVTVTYFVFHPRSNLVGDHTAERVVLQHFHLADMRIRKVNTEILQRAIIRTHQRDRKHPPMENQFGALPVKNHVLHILESQPYLFRIILVMIGDEIFTFRSTCRIKIITPFRQEDPDCVGIRFRRYLLKGFCHQWRSVLAGIRVQSI